jgi:hypothetical protein
MNMKNASTKFLAITFTFIVYAAILFFIMVALPLRAQTNAPDKVGIGNAAATPESQAMTSKAAASNSVAKTEDKGEQSPNQSPQIRIGSNGIQISHGGGKSKGFDIVPIVAIPVVFGSGVTIVAIVLNFNHRRNKMLHETLRAMIDKGMPITPELMADLKTKETKTQPRNDFRSGLILTGVGIGLVMFIGKVGWIVLFIGLAFLIASLVEKRNKNDEQPPKP